MKNKELFAQYDKFVARNYGRYPVSIVEGSGIRVTDAEGRKYLDFVQGIAANTLGHAPKNVAKNITSVNTNHTMPQRKERSTWSLFKRPA